MFFTILVFLLVALAAFCATVPYASLFEYLLHKYVMHRSFAGWKYPFHAHAIVHHGTFKADHTYHLQVEEDRKTIPMKWWNGPALIFVGSLPFLAGYFLFSHWIAVIVGGASCCVGYYATYEYFHWCMHLPKNRWFERTQWFRFINGHHVLHHRYMGYNFNVVLQMWDLLLGTLMVRSSRDFIQVQGPSVPNLQPR